MSLKIDYEHIDNDDIIRIMSELQFVKKSSKSYKKDIYRGPAQTQCAFDVSFQGDTKFIHLPFYYALKNYTNRISRPTRQEKGKMITKFTGKLRPNQVHVKSEAISLLNKNGSCIISLHVGAGKTITSIAIGCKIGLPVVVLTHRLVLIDQWKESIMKVCDNPRIQVVKSDSLLDPEADFYIINAMTVCKKGEAFFNRMGTLIVDELHVMATNKLAESFHYIHPRYMIGLSATPYRSDGMDNLLYSYFGEDKIHKKLFREHYSFRVNTGFVPEYELGRNGELNWGSVLDSQCNSKERNEIIVNIIKYFNTRNFLILSKRVSQCKYLVTRLKEEGVDVTSLVGIKKTFDYNSRVLVTTIQKAGVGFNHPKLDSLVIASDVEEYFIQYLGRVFRTEDVVPIIFDLVDNFKTLKSHYSSRKKIYTDHGGLIMKLDYPSVSKFTERSEDEFNDTFSSILKPGKK